MIANQWFHWVALVAGSLALVASAAETPAPDSATATVKHVNAQEAQKLLADKKIVALDLRTPEEYLAGRIAGSTNIDFMAADFKPKLATLDKSKTYVIFCASGNRSTRALPMFKELQFQSLCHLDGGFPRLGKKPACPWRNELVIEPLADKMVQGETAIKRLGLVLWPVKPVFRLLKVTRPRNEG